MDKDDADLIGYIPWGIIGIASFTTGEIRLIHVDHDNEGNGLLERTKGVSFDWHYKVIKSGGEEL